MVAPISWRPSHPFTQGAQTAPGKAVPRVLSSLGRWLFSRQKPRPELSVSLSQLYSLLNSSDELDDAQLQSLTQALEWISKSPQRIHSSFALILRQCLEALTAKKLHQLLVTVTTKEAQGDVRGLLQSSYPLFSQKKLMEVCEYLYQRPFNLEGLAEELAVSLPRRKVCRWSESLKGGFSQQISGINQFLRHLADLHALSFGLNSLGRPISSQWEAGQQLSVYYMLFSLPFTLFGSLVAFGCSLQIAIGLTLLSLVCFFLGLKVYFHWWRPCPGELEQGLNLVDRVKRLKFPPAIGREAKVEQVLQVLASGHRPMLIGPSGVGKTEIMKGVAYRIAQGEVPPCLRNKKVFLINSGSLHEDAQFNYMSRLKMITERLKGVEDQVILFFDEFQACLGKGTVADQLKSALDEEIKLCAAALTRKDYSRLLDTGEAILRRFQAIEVEEMEDDALGLLLEEVALHAAAHFKLTEEAVTAILQHSPKTEASNGVSRVDGALKILYRAIGAAQSLQEPKPLQDNRKRLARIQLECRRAHGRDIFRHYEAGSLRREILKQEQDWRRRQEVTFSLRRLLRYRIHWEDKLCRMIQNFHSQNEGAQDLKPLAFYAVILPVLQDNIDGLIRKGGAYAITAEKIHAIANSMLRTREES